nr:PHP domain-containing protein [Clostridia bacterium]
MKLYANLHTHSTHSDGGYTPAQLALTAYNEGYGAVMLTDHDTISGYNEFRVECEKFGLETLIGVEFETAATRFNNRSEDTPKAAAGIHFHIVAMDFDPEHPEMKQYISDLCFRKTEITRQLFENAVKRGSISGIEWEEVAGYCRKANKPWPQYHQFLHQKA